MRGEGRADCGLGGLACKILLLNIIIARLAGTGEFGRLLILT